MQRTYIFGCSKEEKIVSVAVSTLMTEGQGAQARDRAREAVMQKIDPGLRAHLLFETGVPDIRIVLEKGAVAAVFYRNSENPPTITVSDLDYSDDQEKDSAALLQEMADGEYQHSSFFVAPV